MTDISTCVSSSVIPAAIVICKTVEHIFGNPRFPKQLMLKICSSRNENVLTDSYLTVMSAFPNGIESVPNVCSWFPTQTTDWLHVLQTEQFELFSMLLTSLWVILASVLLERFTGPLQHSAHHYLIHRGAAPAQRTVVWIPAALCLPAVF